METKKIIFTGGHAGTTAYSVAQELMSRKDAHWEIFWIGVKRSVEGKKAKTLESQILPKLGIKSYHIITGRLQRKFTVWTIPSLMKIPIGIFQSLFLLLKIRPQIILSFGGFASFPVVIAGYFTRTTIVLHDQTTAIGLANKISARFAKTVILAREESRKYIKHKNIKVLGNPIRKEFYNVQPKEKISVPPNIYITGGSRGSKVINDTILDSLDMLKKYKLYHQTGELDFERIKKARKKLSRSEQENYKIFPLIGLTDLVRLLAKIDIYISRSGANTVSEIMVVKRPAVLIPLPLSRHKEQLKNAQKAKKFGIAEIINQEDLSKETLQKALKKIEKNWQKMVKSVKGKPTIDKNAEKRIADLLEKISQK